MTLSVTPMAPAELDRIRILPDAGLGTLRTDKGNLPLARLGVQAKISGLIARSVVTTEFVNSHDTPLEATYVFPLPDRAAVTGMTMTADGRTVEATLEEREAARRTYDQAVAAGKRASIAEEDRPDVFTMRVGNIMPGEHVVVQLKLVGPLAYEDGAATFRFPLVVAPRYIPGTPLPGGPAGDGTALDTDAVPDASRITPPVLLPGFPNPLRLAIGVDIDAAGLTLGEVRSSLHTVQGEGGHLQIEPGERVDRDFILRLDYAGATQAAVAVPDESLEQPQGTYQLTVLPPEPTTRPKPKDVVLLLDRSGSMSGWKMVAARRAAARVVDTLVTGDRFAVRTFDHVVDRPEELGDALAEASDRNRFRAVEFLAKVDARGGTELLAPMNDGLALLADSTRDRVLVLVTDGQVGNEDQILGHVMPMIGATRIHCVGIDRSVNAGFLARLASAGAGRSELVESDDRLDAAMEQIHRRIGSPVITDLAISADGLQPVDGTRSPRRLPSVYPGVPLVVSGRYRGAPGGTLTVTGRTRDDQEFRATVAVQPSDEPAVRAQWARAALRDLEDRYAAGEQELEPAIVATSLRFGVLCRFTAFVAVDSRVVNEGGRNRRVVQPVELPAGWAAGPGSVPMPVHAMTLGAAAVLPPPAAAPMPAGFAPVQARTAGAGAGDALPPAPAPGAMQPATQPAGYAQPPSRSRKAHTFAQVPSTVWATGQTDSLTHGFDFEELLRLEARRLAEGENRSTMERRDLLADLASRLETLISGQSDPRLDPLRALIALLNEPGDVAVKWPAARKALDDILQTRPARTPEPARKPFWKR